MAAAKKYDITVTTRTTYVPGQSDTERGRYVFAYTITLKNTGTVAAQLISRHWIITDATGQIEEVRGPGVVGEQPVLTTGESFQYTSGCPLKTSTGIMRGTYQMVTEEGDRFDVEIAPFALHEPYTVH
jgi:ApaG protein